MTDDTRAEFLPCPFCGGEPIVEDFAPHEHEFISLPEFPGTRCIDCPTCEFRIFDEDPATAHAKWNRRAPALAARVAQLEAALRSIRDAKPSAWESDVRDQFQPWAQNVAARALLEKP